jgi:integrase/recombinase XerC
MTVALDLTKLLDGEPDDPLAKDLASFAAYLMHERRASPRTVEHYLRDLRTLAEFSRKYASGPATIEQIDLAVLRGWLGTRAKARSHTTIARNVSSARAFFRFARKIGRIKEDPSALLKAPKLKRELPVVVSVPAAARLMEAPDEARFTARPGPRSVDPAEKERQSLRDRAMLECLYAGGIRVSELVGFNLNDVDTRNRTARVRGKGGKERIVPLGHPACDAIVTYLDVRHALRNPSTGEQDERALFLGRYGTRLTTRQVQHLVKAYGELSAGRADLHPHTLRHTCATHLLDAGADLRIIQEMLGHASLRTTERYTHVSMEKVMNVYDKAHPLSGREKDKPSAKGGEG